MSLPVLGYQWKHLWRHLREVGIDVTLLIVVVGLILLTGMVISAFIR